MQQHSCHTSVCVLANLVATNASPQVSSAIARPYHLLSCCLVLMARAIESTPLEFQDNGDVVEVGLRAIRKADAARGIQEVVTLIHVAAGVPREVKSRNINGFVPRKASASLRGRIKRERHRVALAALRAEALVR